MGRGGAAASRGCAPSQHCEGGTQRCSPKPHAQHALPSATPAGPAPRGSLGDGAVLASHLRQRLRSSRTLPAQLPAVARLPPGLLSAASATVVQLCSRRGRELLHQGWEVGWDLGPSPEALALAHRCRLQQWSTKKL